METNKAREGSRALFGQQSAREVAPRPAVARYFKPGLPAPEAPVSPVEKLYGVLRFTLPGR